MEDGLLPYLLAAFPATPTAPLAGDAPDAIVIRGYRIPADALDARLLALLQTEPALLTN